MRSLTPSVVVAWRRCLLRARILNPFKKEHKKLGIYLRKRKEKDARKGTHGSQFHGPDYQPAVPGSGWLASSFISILAWSTTTSTLSRVLVNGVGRGLNTVPGRDEVGNSGSRSSPFLDPYI